jgi:hypothetical protein
MEKSLANRSEQGKRNWVRGKMVILRGSGAGSLNAPDAALDTTVVNQFFIFVSWIPATKTPAMNDKSAAIRCLPCEVFAATAESGTGGICKFDRGQGG